MELLTNEANSQAAMESIISIHYSRPTVEGIVGVVMYSSTSHSEAATCCALEFVRVFTTVEDDTEFPGPVECVSGSQVLELPVLERFKRARGLLHHGLRKTRTNWGVPSSWQLRWPHCLQPTSVLQISLARELRTYGTISKTVQIQPGIFCTGRNFFSYKCSLQEEDNSWSGRNGIVQGVCCDDQLVNGDASLTSENCTGSLEERNPPKWVKYSHFFNPNTYDIPGSLNNHL